MSPQLSGPPLKARLQSGGSMADDRITNLPISEIHSEEGALELVRSERMKPYLAFLKAQMSGQDP
jgi:hypothetical protein